MIQDERLDEIGAIAASMLEDANKISKLAEGEDRSPIRIKLDRAMQHLHRFFDEVESACRGEIGETTGSPTEGRDE